MKLLAGDILIHISERYGNKFKLEHAAIVTVVDATGTAYIAHSMYSKGGAHSFRRAGIYQQHINAYFQTGFRGERPRVLVLRTNERLRTILARLANQFAPRHSVAESYIKYMIKTNASYKSAFASERTDNDYVPAYLAYSTLPKLPTPYTMRRDPYNKKFCLALNFFRAYKLVKQKISNPISWNDIDTSERQQAYSLSRKQGMSCDYFIASIVLLGIYHYCIPSELMQKATPLLSNMLLEYEQIKSKRKSLIDTINKLKMQDPQLPQLVTEMRAMQHTSNKLAESSNCQELQSLLESHIAVCPELEFFNRKIKGNHDDQLSEIYLAFSNIPQFNDGSLPRLFECFELPINVTSSSSTSNPVHIPNGTEDAKLCNR